jgi:hypothetical protein
MMTEKELAEIRARVAEATPDPWHAESINDFCLAVSNRVESRYMPEYEDVEAARRQIARDAEFVVHARADVEALVNEVERLRARLAAIGGGYGEHD